MAKKDNSLETKNIAEAEFKGHKNTSYKVFRKTLQNTQSGENYGEQIVINKLKNDDDGIVRDRKQIWIPVDDIPSLVEAFKKVIPKK